MTSAQIGTLMERFAAMDIASRREVLQELTIMSGAILLQPVRRWLAQVLAVVPLVSPESVSDDALDALERATMLFRRWDASGVGGLRRKAVVGHAELFSRRFAGQRQDRVLAPWRRVAAAN